MADAIPLTSVNAASADARVDDTTPVKASTPTTTNGPPPKRARFTKPTPGKRHGGAFFAKEKPTTSLSIVPRKSYFPIFVSNFGCRDLASDCYRIIQAKDFRLANNITSPQLQYVTAISLLNRMVQCSIHYGYAFPLQASRLKQVASGIQLPSVLATYVEAIGSFVLTSGATVVPYVNDFTPLIIQALDVQFDPTGLLEPGVVAEHEAWPIHVDTIVTYNEATTRASRSGMNFRIVNNNDFTGRAEMLVSYQHIGADMLLPKAPQQMSEAEAQLGVCYRFRDYTQREAWLGEHKELMFDAFTAIPVDPKVIFSDVCVAAFKGATVSTD